MRKIFVLPLQVIVRLDILAMLAYPAMATVKTSLTKIEYLRVHQKEYNGRGNNVSSSKLKYFGK